MFARSPLLGVAGALALFTLGITGSVVAQTAPDVSVTVKLDDLAYAAGHFDVPVAGQPPDEVLVDQPLKILIKGLTAEQQFRLRITSTDAANVKWEALSDSMTAKTFNADPDGAWVVRSKGRTLQDGDMCALNGDDIMKLFGKMLPVGRSNSSLQYAWSNENSGTFTVSVLDGDKELGSGSVVRSIGTKPDPFQHNTTDTTASGIHWYGQFFDPPSYSPSATAYHPGILIFGGSEGGLHQKIVLTARLLAARGYTTLALAYWRGKPGPPDAFGEVNGVPKLYWEALPESLKAIPLETFREALHLLAERKGVDNHRLFVSGTSRGSEAALWLASNPDFVDDVSVTSDRVSARQEPLNIYGVNANVPSSVINTCLWYWLNSECDGGAWSRDLPGTDVLPYTRTNVKRVAPDAQPFDDPDTDRNETDPEDVPEATIPVSNFRGPILLDCGERDDVWPGGRGCTYLKILKQNLKRPADDPTVVAVRCAQGGHGLGTLVPYVPWDPKDATEGGSSQGAGQFSNQAADAALWPQVLQFLEKYGPDPNL